MANVIFKSDERKDRQQQIMKDFNIRGGSKEQKEHAEYIAEKSHETLRRMKNDNHK